MEPSPDSQSKIRVLSLVENIGVSGGGERLARETIGALDPDRFARTLCVTRWDPASLAAPAVREAMTGLDEAGVGFVGLERSSTYDLWSWRRLLGALRERHIDVLHAHKFGSNVWASVLGTLAGTPVIVAHEHTWSFEGQPMRRFLDRELIARRCDAVIAVSTEDRRRMIEVERIPAEKIVFIPNGIPSPPTAGSGEHVRAELGIDPEAPLVGSVGDLRPQKRFDVLIRAAAELRRSLPDVRVAIAGGGDETPLRELIDQLGLEETVILAGRRSDVPDFIAALDVAVNSSDFEGSPLSIMEYMEGSLPVVATRVGGVPDLIEDGINGLLVEPGNPGALAGAIAGLLADPRASLEMGLRNRRRRREEFDLATMARRLEGLYEELLGGGSRR